MPSAAPPGKRRRIRGPRATPWSNPGDGDGGRRTEGVILRDESPRRAVTPAEGFQENFDILSTRSWRGFSEIQPCE